MSATTEVSVSGLPPTPRRFDAWLSHDGEDLRVVYALHTESDGRGHAVIWTRSNSERLNICWMESWMRWVKDATLVKATVALSPNPLPA